MMYQKKTIKDQGCQTDYNLQESYKQPKRENDFYQTDYKKNLKSTYQEYYDAKNDNY